MHHFFDGRSAAQCLSLCTYRWRTPDFSDGINAAGARGVTAFVDVVCLLSASDFLMAVSTRASSDGWRGSRTLDADATRSPVGFGVRISPSLQGKGKSVLVILPSITDCFFVCDSAQYCRTRVPRARFPAQPQYVSVFPSCLLSVIS